MTAIPEGIPAKSAGVISEEISGDFLKNLWTNSYIKFRKESHKTFLKKFGKKSLEESRENFLEQSSRENRREIPKES